MNPYILLFDTFGGSGYDIACAEAEGPVLYQLLEDELHEPNLTSNEIAVFETPRRPIASALGTIKNVGGYAIDSVWHAAINSTSAISPF